MRILLTGHRGFIGRNLHFKLKERFSDVAVIEKDFIDNPFWRTLLNEYLSQYDLVFHVGAIADTTLQDSAEMLKYNYTFSRELFNLAQKYKKKVIYSSSAACLGDGDGVPNNIYGWSKLLAEDYGMAKCDEFVSLRYFNVYGPGEEDKGKMASVAYQAWKKGIFRLFPSKPKRDFIHVDDVVDANIAAINNAPKGIYEVGYGEACTFESLLDGMGIKYTHHDSDKAPPWYQYYTCADETKRVPYWKPSLSVELGTKKYRKYLDSGANLHEISSDR